MKRGAKLKKFVIGLNISGAETTVIESRSSIDRKIIQYSFLIIIYKNKVDIEKLHG